MGPGSAQARWQAERQAASSLEGVERELARMAASIALQAPMALKPVAEAMGAYLRRPGKRVRARLCLAGEALCGHTQRSAAAVRVAAALEAVHAFLLIHDDVMDRAEVRRGMPALHVSLRPDHGPQREKVGEDLAIVAGDWLYTLALREVLRAPGLDAPTKVTLADTLLEICAATAQGQALDVVNGVADIEEVTAAGVLETYRLKTARYTFEAPLLAGATIGGGGPELLASLRAFSRSAGVAFQLVDDLLGLFASDAQLGKPAVSDLQEGKKTWPLLRAHALVDDAERAWLAAVVSRKDAGCPELELARALVRRSGAFDEALLQADTLLQDARRHLAPIPDSPALSQLVAVVDSIEAALSGLDATSNHPQRAL